MTLTDKIKALKPTYEAIPYSANAWVLDEDYETLRKVAILLSEVCALVDEDPAKAHTNRIELALAAAEKVLGG